jgi:hypothetical protein
MGREEKRKHIFFKNTHMPRKIQATQGLVKTIIIILKTKYSEAPVLHNRLFFLAKFR